MKTLSVWAVLISLMLVLCRGSAYPLAGPTDPAEMQSFMDGFITQGLAKYHVPGAVFIFVKDGRVFFKKGYGYADLEKKTPMDPDRTVVRVGSNSKLYTATAVMQLAEQGKLKLDTDVNTYLKDTHIPATWPRPITMLNLLTHTAGFDERNLGMATLDEKKIIPMGRYIKNDLPERVMEPGTVTSYSNMGFTIAGYIVETISGEPFHAYVREHIFKPLGMASSDFLPRADLRARMAVPYLYRGGAYTILPLEYEYCYPAGSVMTTASDMARFIIAHLHNGRYGTAVILKPESAEFMHHRQFSNHPELPGIGVCFIEFEYRGEKMLEHGGWVTGFKTLSTLLPSRDAGFFLSYNVEYAGPASVNYALAREVQKALIDHYYAAAGKAPAAAAGDIRTAKKLEGSYRTNRLSRFDLTKFAVFTADLKVKALPDGSIMAGKDRYIPKDRLVFMKDDGSDLTAFREDGRGRVTHLFMGSNPVVAWDRLAWYETSTFHLALLIFCIFVFIVSFITAAAVHIRRKRRGIRAAAPVRWAWRIIAAVSFFDVAMLTAMIILLLNSIHISFQWELPTGLVELLALGVFSTLLSVVLIGLTVYLMARGIGGILDHAFAGVMCVAALGFTWFLYYWNLLGFRLG